jgi:hypothetical protein
VVESGFPACSSLKAWVDAAGPAEVMQVRHEIALLSVGTVCVAVLDGVG